ncbi:MAG TPA: hypothetical protein VF533_06720 [Solirubrobacteraceae bacterium]|jgi:hypothetical protein
MRRLSGTEALGAAAVAATGAAVALEYVHVWRRGSAPLPGEARPEELAPAAAEAARETVIVAVEGYRSGSARENALLNLLLAFSATFGGVRFITHQLRDDGRFGPFRNVSVGRRHIHHFVPGIVLSWLAGGGAILSRRQQVDPWLAIPFGAGAALVLDEAALLLELEDVYWTERGVVSVQVTLGAIALLGAAATAVRVLRRGEREVLGPPAAGPVGSPP